MSFTGVFRGIMPLPHVESVCALKNIENLIIPLPVFHSLILREWNTGSGMIISFLYRCLFTHTCYATLEVPTCVPHTVSVFVCVCVRLCVNQRLKDVASSNSLYSDGYVKLRTDLRPHAVIDREEKRVERGTFYMCCAVCVVLNACKPCDSGAGKKNLFLVTRTPAAVTIN